jgi:hypothetical protein
MHRIGSGTGPNTKSESVNDGLGKTFHGRNECMQPLQGIISILILNLLAYPL